MSHDDHAGVARRPLAGKRLLFLGGLDIQIPAIQRARELGAYVITCDYLPSNPGHRHADEYHNVSTTDMHAVLELAKRLRVDGISAYASDPAALTAAYVSEQMGWPGNRFSSIAAISNKRQFRLVQQTLGIPFPRLAGAAEANDILEAIQSFPFGAIIKPVDSSGSKGVRRVPASITASELRAVAHEAQAFSRAKEIVVEEFMPRRGFLMSGDVLIDNGKIRFHCFGDVHFNDRINGLVPRSISLPASNQDHAFFERLLADLQRIIDHLGIRTGVFNCDVIEDARGRPVVLDIGARNGGNLFNDIIGRHTGVDLIGLTMRQSLHQPFDISEPRPSSCYAHVVLHAIDDGKFDHLYVDPDLNECIFYRTMTVERGDPVRRFVHSGCRLGVALVEFRDFRHMHAVLGRIYDFIRVVTS